MYRPIALCLAVGIAVSFLSVLDKSLALGQQAPGQVPVGRPLVVSPVAEATLAGGVPSVQVGQAPGQLGRPQHAAAPAQSLGQPFQLSPVEKQFVDQILLMWETESDKVKTFDCKFERWEYDKVWGPTNGIALTKSLGQLTYSKPDKGSFKIKEIKRWTKADPNQEGWEPGSHVLQKHEVGEHWVCDGKAVFQYNHEAKQLVVNPLPPAMRGKAIGDGPLPFLFGAKAAKLNNRYWIRSKQGEAGTIWLEAFPRHQADAANYHHVDIMLERKTMLPTALQVHEPNGQSKAVYIFDKQPTVNGTLNKLFGNIFNAPRTPFGWKRVVRELPPAAPQAAQPQNTKQR